MSIEACVEVQKGIYLDAPCSKAVATFCLLPLMVYCDFRSGRWEDEEYKEMNEWVSAIASRMQEDLCILERAISSSEWDYSEDDYERFCGEMNQDRAISQEQFVKACRDLEQKWTSTELLKRVVDDFTRIVEEIHPQDRGWYEEEHSLPQFKSLSESLALAMEKGYLKVRLACG
jgi:hypothetical protein